MGVKIKKRNGAWWVFINHHGRRKAKKVGTREAALRVRGELEARLALGDVACLAESPEPTFAAFAEKWLRTDALRCKPSTVDFYKDYQQRYVIPQFGQMKLAAITRDDIKAFMADLNEKGLAKNTIRLAVASLRVVLSSAVEDGVLAVNPALRLGRFVESHKPEREAQAMEPQEAERFLIAAQEYCPAYYPLFMIALRAGLREGEILGLHWGDFQFGKSEDEHSALYFRPAALVSWQIQHAERKQTQTRGYVAGTTPSVNRTTGSADARGVAGGKGIDCR